jgi:hypothetical protein
VAPYGTHGWCCDGVRRKLNVYICATGLAPHPGDAAWAHMGTHVEHAARGSSTWAHPLANADRKLHHSYLALCSAAARCEATCVHELTHVRRACIRAPACCVRRADAHAAPLLPPPPLAQALQMHTGGFVDSPLVGYLWEAHAEYCVHLYRPNEAGWAHALPAFLESAHLPPGATRSADDAPDGRQYCVWPWLAWLDRARGARTAHGLWAADFAHRCAHGASRDPLATLADQLGGWRALNDALSGQWALAVATAHFGADADADAAIRGACDVLSPRRLALLRPPRRGATAWRCDTARPLKQHGVCVHRLAALPGADAAARVRVLPDDAVPPGALRYALVRFDAATGERRASAVHVCSSDDAGITFAPDGAAWLLAVTAAPDAPVDVPWGVQPSALPTHGYTVALEGCAPHADSSPPPRPPPPPLLLLPPGAAALAVPTGLANLLPHGGGGGGATLTERDVRSGEPGATNLVWLRHAVSGGAHGLRITHVAFSYRTVVGYSGNDGDPGPRFELVAFVEPLTDDGDDENDAVASPQALRVLYCSPQFGARPWHYDACSGGSPTNYSPRCEVSAPCDVALPAGARMRLALRFVNGRRNCHLQGGGWPQAPPAELQLRLSVAA